MPYTNIAKPTNDTYTSVAKPTNATYTSIAKPIPTSTSKTIVAGMSIGLLIPLTISVAQTVGVEVTGYTKIAKPTG